MREVFAALFPVVDYLVKVLSENTATLFQRELHKYFVDGAFPNLSHPLVLKRNQNCIFKRELAKITITPEISSCPVLFFFHFCFLNAHQWAHYTLRTSSLDTGSLCISTFSFCSVRVERWSLPSILHLHLRHVKFMSCLDNTGCKSFSQCWRRCCQTVSVLTKHLTFRCSRMLSDLTPALRIATTHFVMGAMHFR